MTFSKQDLDGEDFSHTHTLMHTLPHRNIHTQSGLALSSLLNIQSSE